MSWTCRCRLQRRTGQRAQSSWGTSERTTQCSACGMDTPGPAASRSTPGSWPCIPSASGWSGSEWWTWRTCVKPWNLLPAAHSRNTWRRGPNSSWSWTNRRPPPCPCRSTRNRAAQWCGGTSGGKWASASSRRWRECHLQGDGIINQFQKCRTFRMRYNVLKGREVGQPLDRSPVNHRSSGAPAFQVKTQHSWMINICD